MSITPGGWTSFDNPSSNPYIGYQAQQPANQSITPTGAYSQLAGVLFGQSPAPADTSAAAQTNQANQTITPSSAYSQYSNILFGQAPSGYTPNFGQTQPAAAVRDPRYNGMPDEMYNNMIKHQQQRQAQIQRNLDNGLTGFDAYAIPETADIKSWDMWMAENPNGIQPPASIHLDNQPQPPIGMIGKGGGQPIAQPAPTPAPGQAPFAQDYQQYVFERNLGLQTPDSPPVLDYQTWLSQNPQGDQRFRMPAPAPTPAPAPVTQPKQNSLTQALARTRTAGQGYVRPQARQVARNTQPRLSTAPIRNRTK